jgi:hypothetical protein
LTQGRGRTWPGGGMADETRYGFTREQFEQARVAEERRRAALAKHGLTEEQLMDRARAAEAAEQAAGREPYKPDPEEVAYMAMGCDGEEPDEESMEMAQAVMAEEDAKDMRREVLEGVKRWRRLRADRDACRRILEVVAAALEADSALDTAEEAGVSFGLITEPMFTVLDELGKLVGLCGEDVWLVDKHRTLGPKVAANVDAIRAHIDARYTEAIDWLGGVDALGGLAE